MTDLDTRISALLEASENWLTADNEYLSVAYDQTVREGYFSFEDVKHALLAIKNSINEIAIREWAEEAGLTDSKHAQGINTLCLHAGNIPLVGFQNAFATMLAGATYYGKISRKDPYLLPTFLNEVKKTGVFSSTDVQWVHNLDHLEGLKADTILFAGSEDSVPGVRESLQKLNIVNRDTRFLIRTAHFSMAYLQNKKSRSMKDLVEAIFRYGGKGCRSVAIVVAPYGLDEIKCEFTDYIESFWLDNPQQKKPGPKLKQRFAYNKAVERPQAWLDDFLLQEGGLEMDQDFICYWIRGDKLKVAELAEQFNTQLQTIYVADPDIIIPGFKKRTEFLSDAQRPPLSWKPDGTDTLEWLMARDKC